MAEVDSQTPLLGETTCGSLLQQLQKIWDEVGESDEERDKMLLQLEQECLDVYRRKVDLAAKSRAHLLQALADANLKLSRPLSALGETNFPGIPEKPAGTIKEQLAAIAPALEQLWKQKEERIKEFSDVQFQIQRTCGEIAGSNEQAGSHTVDESDLTLKKLDELELQNAIKGNKAIYPDAIEFNTVVMALHDDNAVNYRNRCDLAGACSSRECTPREAFCARKTLKHNIIAGCIQFLNCASEHDLKMLRGIGPQRARDIIEFREKSLIKNLEDLKYVSMHEFQIKRLLKSFAEGMVD